MTDKLNVYEADQMKALYSTPLTLTLTFETSKGEVRKEYSLKPSEEMNLTQFINACRNGIKFSLRNKLKRQVWKEIDTITFK